MRNKQQTAAASRWPWLAGLLAAALVILLAVALFRRPPPQMGPDDRVFRTVDALFTAVTARDEKLLGQSEQKLRSYRDAGHLPQPAAVYLDGIIAQSRAGNWEQAARSLHRFMLAQRREPAA